MNRLLWLYLRFAACRYKDEKNMSHPEDFVQLEHESGLGLGARTAGGEGGSGGGSGIGVDFAGACTVKVTWGRAVTRSGR